MSVKIYPACADGADTPEPTRIPMPGAAAPAIRFLTVIPVQPFPLLGREECFIEETLWFWLNQHTSRRGCIKSDDG